MEEEKIQIAEKDDQKVPQDTPLTEKKTEKQPDLPAVPEPENAGPKKTRSRRNAIDEKQFLMTLKEEHTDSDKEPLHESEYYEREIEHLRSCIQQIHELRALLKDFPSISDINDAVVKNKKKKGIKYVNKYMKKWDEFREKNSNIASWYEELISQNTDNSVLESLMNIYDNDIFDIMALHGICDMNNQGKILPFRANIYSRLEKYKQDRDMSRFIDQSKSLALGKDFKNKTIYSFKLGSTVVYGYLDSNNDFCTFKTKEEFVQRTVSVDNTKKDKVEKKYDEEVAKIKAIGELEQKLDASGLMDQINLETITSYMNFNEDEFEKKAAAYRLIAAKKAIEKPTAASADGGYDGEGKSGIRGQVVDTIKDNALDIAESVPEKVITVLDKIKIRDVRAAKLLLDNMSDNKNWSVSGDLFKLIDDNGETKDFSKIEVFRGLCKNGGIGLLKMPVEVISIFKNCSEVSAMIDDIAHAGLIGNGGFFSDETEKLLATANFITNDIIAKSASATLSAVENVTKIVAGAGGISLKTMSDVLSTTGSIASGISIGSGIINTGKGIYDIAKATHDLHEAENAEQELGKYDMNYTSKNRRILHNAEISARERRAQGILNTATGAVDIASGIVGAIPAAGVAGTVLSLTNMALKFIGKFAISKYFKGKRKDQAWSDILNFSNVDEYKAFEDRVGKENFRRVLRRRTGVATRQAYSDALNITDAIDIFTMAKIHSGNPDSNDVDEKVTQITLSGVGYSDPKKYKYLRLNDVLAKVGADNNWKGTLKASITDKKGVFSRKTREKSEDIA